MMEWTDTLMLEPAFRREQQNEPSGNLDARAISIRGVHLIQAIVNSRQEASEALKLLRGFSATGRRFVFCDSNQIVLGRQFGGEIVVHGHAQHLLACGIGSREIAVGARDAGLELANVTVCTQQNSACDVLLRNLRPGDTVLLLGIESNTFRQLVRKVEKHFLRNMSVAA